MATKVLDLKGLKCPQPTLRLTIEAKNFKAGDTVELVADCPTFLDDTKKWCERMGKTFMWSRAEGTANRISIQF